MTVSFVFTIPNPRTVQFIDTTSPPANFWHWDFGDGNTSNLQDPLHTYAGTDDQTFTVTLETDPYASLVVSQLPFNENAQTDPALNADSKPYNTDDLKGVHWTLQSFNKIEGIAGFGQVSLPAWSLIQSPITRVCLHSDVTPSFAASGDYTMEFTVAPDNTRGQWGASSAIILISGLASNHGTGPVNPSEWMVSWTAGGGGSLGFITKAADGSLKKAGQTPITFPLVQHVVAVQRISGVLSILLDGVTIGVQDPAEAADNTPPLAQVTFSTNADGSQIGENNIGHGTYSQWRYTVGAGRYPSGSYTPEPFGITSFTEPVEVPGVPPPPPPTPLPGSKPVLPTLPYQRLIGIEQNFD